MMMTLQLALAALAALQSPEQEYNCDAPMTQSDMNACAAIDFERADVALNAAWRDAVAREREADREIPQSDPRGTGEAKLREAQRAWITFRDAHCTVQSWEARGGSMESMLFNGCRTLATEERTRQLRGEHTPETER